MRLAIAEADDIEEMSVDKRFARLQDAEADAQSLEPPLEKDLMDNMEKYNIALAAERGLVMAFDAAKAMKAGLEDAATIIRCWRERGHRSQPYGCGMCGKTSHRLQ